MQDWFNFRFLRFTVLLVVIIANAGCDQMSKLMVREHVDAHAQIPLIKDHVTLTNVENTGAFLSLGDDLPKYWKSILLSGLPMVVLIYLSFLVLFNRSLSSAVALGLAFITGGGLGNILDRIRFGSVTDFLHLDFVVFQTGIFNLADLSITFGTILVVTSMLFGPKSIANES